MIFSPTGRLDILVNPRVTCTIAFPANRSLAEIVNTTLVMDDSCAVAKDQTAAKRHQKKILVTIAEMVLLRDFFIFPFRMR